MIIPLPRSQEDTFSEQICSNSGRIIKRHLLEAQAEHEEKCPDHVKPDSKRVDR